MLYKNFNRFYKNGYVIVAIPDHPKSFDTGNGLGVYEHIYVAELFLGRRLLEGEVVHHLDGNRENNSPDNLLILQNPMHVKLHAWMDKNTITPNPQYLLRKQMGCIRCVNCEIPIAMGFKFCSHSCHDQQQRLTAANTSGRSSKPSKEVLEVEIKIYPMTTLAVKYGVSDNTIRNWCKSYGIELENRLGYWAKQRARI